MISIGQTRERALWAISLLLLVLSCSRNARPQRLRASHATCEAVCEYYEDCKGSHNGIRYDQCIGECRGVFSEDGAFDKRSLLDLQRLECSRLLDFIEGADHRSIPSEK